MKSILEINEVLILSLEYFEEKPLEKALVQERIFFLGELLKKQDITINFDLGYTANFYGAYSQEISDCLSVSILNGYIDEYSNHLQAEYQLSKKGKKLAKDIEKEFPEQSKQLKDTIKFFMQIAGNLNYRELSFISKIYNIIKRNLFKISEESMLNGIKALQELKLIKSIYE